MVNWLTLLFLGVGLAYACWTRGAIYATDWGILVIGATCCLLWLHLLKLFRSQKTFAAFPWCLKVALAIFLLVLASQSWLVVSQPLDVSHKLHQSLAVWQVSTTVETPISPYHSRRHFYQFLLPTFTFLLLPLVLKRRKHFYFLLLVLSLLLLWQTCYGLYQFVSDSPRPQFAVRGTFVTRNTFACWVAMLSVFLLGGALALTSRQGRRLRTRNWRARLSFYFLNHPWFVMIASLLLLCLFGLLVVFLSYSRGGIFSLAMGIVCLGWLFFCYHPQQRYTWPERIAWLVVLVIPVIAYVTIVGGADIFLRFGELQSGLSNRWELWQQGLKVFWHHPLWGCGGDCYQFALEIYRSKDFKGHSIYVHNDYLQFLAEYGMIGGGSLGVFLVIWTKEAWQRKPRSSHFYFCIWAGAISALVVIFLHAIVDFSLYIPGHRFVTAVFMTIPFAIQDNC